MQPLSGITKTVAHSEVTQHIPIITIRQIVKGLDIYILVEKTARAVGKHNLGAPGVDGVDGSVSTVSDNAEPR